MVLFKDINKSANDLLTREYVHERPWEVEFKHRSKNPLFIQNAFLNSSNVFDATSTVKFVFPTSSSLEARMGTNISMVDALYKSSYVKGLTLGGRMERKSAAPAKVPADMVDLSAEFLNKERGIHGRLTFNPIVPSWTASGVIDLKSGERGETRIGGEVLGTSDIRNIRYSVGMAYAHVSKDLAWTGTLKTAPASGTAINKVIGNLHVRSNVTGAAELGAELVHSVPESKTTVSFGGLWYLNGNGIGKVSDSVLRAKLSQDGKISTAITHKFSDALTATLGAQLDSPKSGTNADAVKCGVKLNISA